MGYSSEYQEGAGEKGSDIVVTVKSPLVPDEFTVGVQAFSFEGTVGAASVQRKLDQLLAGWEYWGLQYGVLMTTGELDSEARKLLEEHNRKNLNRRVTVIEGKGVAKLFLEWLGTVQEREA
jgi:hypothetical protein